MADPLKSLDMGKKLGPLPRGAWVGIIVVGVIGGLYLRDRSSSTTAAAATTDPNVDSATGETWAQEAAQAQAAQSEAAGAGSAGDGGGTSGTSGTTVDDTGAIAQLDTDLNAGLSTLQQQEASDAATLAANTPGSPTYNISVTPPPVAAKPQNLPKLKPGAIRLTSGPTKPAAPPGFTTQGEGNGNWEAVPIPAKIVRPTNPPSKQKPSVHKPTVTVRKPVTQKKKK